MLHQLALLLLVPLLARASNITVCSADADCRALNAQPQIYNSQDEQTYVCVNNQCRIVGGAGNICYSKLDCALYHVVASNSSSYQIPARLQDPTFQFCSASYCTLASVCQSNTDIIFGSAGGSPTTLAPDNSVQQCCAGNLPQPDGGNDPTQAETCTFVGSVKSINTCPLGSNCLPDPSGTYRCLGSSTGSSQWIGIVICLIGAATLNIGLNLQKLALRKRFLRQQKEKRNQERRILNNIVSRFTNFSITRKRPSRASEPSGSSTNANNAGTSSAIAAIAPPIVVTNGDDGAQPEADSPDTPNIVPVSILANYSSDDTPANQIQFQKQLHMGKLLKDPIWMLGIIIFTLGNFCNFIALQFAPQSLVAPLGSMSLVVNVVAAPLINREKWSWKDLLGVVFIVAGSVLSVANSGVSSQDYNLCVILALFQTARTITFLAITAALIIGIFLFIVVVERNMDLDPAISPAGQSTVVPAIPNETEHSEAFEPMEPVKRVNFVTAAISRVKNTLAPNEGKSVDGSIASPTKSPRSIFRSLTGESVTEEPSVIVPAETNKRASIASPVNECHAYIQHEQPVHDPIVMLDRSGNIDSEMHEKVVVLDDYDNPMQTELASSQAVPRLISHQTSTRSVPASREDEGTLVAERPDGTLSRSALGEATPEIKSRRTSLVPDAQSQAPPINMSMMVSSGFLVNLGRFEFLKVPPPATGDVATTHLGGGNTSTFILNTTASQYNDSDFEEVRSTRADGILSNLKATIAKFPSEFYRKYTPHWLKMFFDSLERVRLVPVLKNKIPLHSRVVSYGLPLCYASIGGCMGTVTVLFAKATIHLITTSIFQGNNQYTQIWAWVISGITVFTAMSQLYWLNMGLQRYDALLQIPVFYVVWTTFDVIGGGIYFDEFSNFTAAKYVWFCFALLIIFIGVAILANRLKALEDDNREFEKKVQSHQQDALSVQEEARPE